MLFPKKTIALILGTSTIVGGAVAVKYFLTSNAEIDTTQDLEFQKALEKEEIKKAHNLALKMCKPNNKCDRTKKILSENENLKFDFKIK